MEISLMEEAVSNFQTSIITLMIYIVATAAFSYLLVLPVLNQLGLNRQISHALSKITFILITIAVFYNYFRV